MNRNWDQYDESIPPPPISTLASEGEAHEKLRRNLNVALDVHLRAMNGDLPPDLPTGEKRLMVESAHNTVKAALATDRTALKARQENTMEIAMLRVWFTCLKLGETITPEEEEKLRIAPRAKLEAALGLRQMLQYDQMMNATNRGE